jgi:hypothetical protein
MEGLIVIAAFVLFFWGINKFLGRLGYRGSSSDRDSGGPWDDGGDGE